MGVAVEWNLLGIVNVNGEVTGARLTIMVVGICPCHKTGLHFPKSKALCSSGFPTAFHSTSEVSLDPWELMYLW